MELRERTREELLDMAKSLKLEVAKNITTEDLRAKVELEAIRHTVKVEEEVRADLQAKAKIKRDIAEIRATAELNNIEIKIPITPTLADVVRLQKELNIKKKEPKPSPETVAIQASKRVYAIFHNQEEDDVDMKCIPGGKYHFHFWPERIHVIPEWLVGYMRRQARVPIMGNRKNPLTEAMESVRIGWKNRVLFEVLGDAPKDAPFGVVLDEGILEKFKQPI